MGSPSKSPPRRRGPKPRPNTRENLVGAGLRLLHEAGYSATGIKDIVDAADVPKGSFYAYFESKEAFAEEVVDAYFSNALDDLTARLGNDAIAPLVRLQSYFAERIKGFKAAGFKRGCLLGNMGLELSDHSDPVRSRVVVHFTTWSELLERCIAQAQHSGAIANQLPASLLAQFVLNAWEGALLRMRVDKSDVPLNHFTTVVFDSVLV